MIKNFIPKRKVFVSSFYDIPGLRNWFFGGPCVVHNAHTAEEGIERRH
jgi:hypothetical protein